MSFLKNAFIIKIGRTKIENRPVNPNMIIIKRFLTVSLNLSFSTIITTKDKDKNH